MNSASRITHSRVPATPAKEHTMYTKAFPCGTKVIVSEYLVSFEDGHPSNVDYYYAEDGYNCASEEEVADQYHENHCLCLKRNRQEASPDWGALPATGPWSA